MKNNKSAEFRRLGLVLLALFFMVNCGGGVQSGLISPYRVQYQGVGCTTPMIESSTHDEYCRNLADNSKNIDPVKGIVCAEEQRHQDFLANCPGYPWPN